MLDLAFFDAACEDAPKLNRKIAEGFAYHEMPTIYSELDKMLHAAFSSSSCGVRYEGYSQVSCYEQFARATKPKNSKRHFETNRTDTHLVKYKYSLNGQPLESRYLEIPIIGPYSTIILRGYEYTLFPMLSDRLFSITNGSKPEKRGIFMPVARKRIAFQRMPYSFLLSGKHENADFVWARLYSDNRKNSAPQTKYPQLFNYHLCVYGLTGAFKYFGYDVQFGDDDVINEDNYPPSEWKIAESVGRHNRVNGNICRVKIAVKIDQFKQDRTLASLLSSFFYILDNTQGNEFIKTKFLENTSTWKRILARFIWKDFDEVTAIQQIEGHIESIENYVDAQVTRKLLRSGIEVDTTLGLLAYMIRNYSNIINNFDTASIRGKRLQVVEQMVFYVATMIYKIIFELERKDPATLTPAIVNKIFTASRNVRYQPYIIHKSLQDSSSMLAGLDSTTDLMPLKVTNQVVSSSRIKGSKVAAERKDPAFKLHPELMMAHSVLMVTKSGPSSRGRIQPFITLGPNNEVLASEEMERYIKDMEDHM